MTLQDFFKENSSCALAFSGGTDSALLLYAAVKYGADVTAYYGKSPFQPEFEMEDAKRLVSELGAQMRIVELNPLSDENIRRNGPDRCYHCKNAIFSAIIQAARADGYELIIDGTNASDDADDRPGMRALAELGVRSPLRECGITKPMVREMSCEAGLFTAQKPAYACLATRIPTGEEITAENLIRTEKCENALMEMGFRDFRLRKRGETALLQVTAEQMPLAEEKLEDIRTALKEWYSNIELDLTPRASSL